MTLKLAARLEKPEPLAAGIKTITRRHWTLNGYRRILKSYLEGKRTHHAWSSCSFVKGAYPIGLLELTQAPYWEKLEDMPEEDVYHEGNLWANKEEFIQMLDCAPQTYMCVLRFQFSPLSK